MISCGTQKFGKQLYILYPGDYYCTEEDAILGTVTGLCIAVCLYDKTRGIGGMGHFIVPGAMGTEGIVSDDIARHAITNIEYLIADIVKKGGDRRFLKAKIFGAGYGVTDVAHMEELANSNIRFVHEYFSLENITIQRVDLGGDFRRKIFFSIKDGTVFRQILKHNEDSSEFIKLENEYVSKELKEKKKSGKVVLFD